MMPFERHLAVAKEVVYDCRSQKLPEPVGLHIAAYTRETLEFQLRSEADMTAWADWAEAAIESKVSRVNPAVTLLSLELDYEGGPVRFYASIETPVPVSS